MRSLASMLFALAACGAEVRPYSTVTLTVAVSGPGAVLVSGGANARCTAACELTIARGAEVTLIATARPGAGFSGYSGACSGSDSCALRVDADVAAAAAFDWSPLPRVTRYSWKRIDGGPLVTYLVDLDSFGNAYGFQDARVNEFFPVRYDAVNGEIERLPGIDRCQVIAANDAGQVLAHSEEGVFRYDGGTWRRIDTDEPGHLLATDLSDEGWIVGVRYIDSLNHVYQPWVHDGAQMVAWGDGETRAQAMAVNNAGQVVGDHGVDELFPGGWAWVTYPVLIERDRVEILPIGRPSDASDLSDTGLVVGGIHDLGLRGKAYLYDLASGVLDVIEPLEGDIAIDFERTSPSGAVVAGFATDQTGAFRPIVHFVNERRTVDLRSLVNLPPDWELDYSVSAVNVHGQMLVRAWLIGERGVSPWVDLILTPE